MGVISTPTSTAITPIPKNTTPISLSSLGRNTTTSTTPTNSASTPNAAATEPGIPAGIQIPPEEIKNIINTTASFVARLGANFETKIFSKEKNNPKFSFLQNTDPFHRYYSWKVQEHRDKLGDQAAPASTLPVSERDQDQEKAMLMLLEEEKKKEEKEEHPLLAQLRREKTRKATSVPPPNFEFILDLPYDLLSAQDLDIMKLTAQFVAQNGRQFHLGLTNREFKNPQFDFLKPNHHLHPMFSQLVDCYTKCLLPQRGLNERLKSESSSKKPILDRVLYRLEWEREIMKQRKNLEDKEQEERIARALIDWQDFVVVETIDFDDEDEEQEEEEEPTRKPGPAGMGQGGEDQDVAMDEEEMLTEEMEVESNAKPEPEPEMKIRKDYAGRAYPQSLHSKSLRYQICPQCGQAVPIEEMEEHMRIETSDPKARELKRIQNEKARETSLADGQDIIKHLDKFAKRRTDIFGDFEELEIGKSSNDQSVDEDYGRMNGGRGSDPNDKIFWDGHAGSIAVTTSHAQTQNHGMNSSPSPTTSMNVPTYGPSGPSRPAPTPGTSLEEQIAAIHASKGAPPKVDDKSLGPKSDSLLPTPKNGPNLPPHLSMSYHPPPGTPGYATISTAYATPAGSGSGSGPGSSSFPDHHSLHHPPPPGSHYPPPHLSYHQPSMINHPGMQPPGMSSGSGAPQSNNSLRHPAPPLDDEPESKKQKLEEPQLIPEQEFAAKYPAPVDVFVQVPDSSRPEWGWQSQRLEIKMKVTQTVAELKERIKEQLKGMPPNKQKLKIDGSSLFLKDNLSLAYYNIADTSLLILGLRERGGRK